MAGPQLLGAGLAVVYVTPPGKTALVKWVRVVGDAPAGDFNLRILDADDNDLGPLHEGTPISAGAVFTDRDQVDLAEGEQLVASFTEDGKYIVVTGAELNT